MSDPSTSRGSLANAIRIVFALLLILTSVANIVGAALTGQIRTEVTYIDQPILFLVVLTGYAIILLGGLWWLWDAIARLRAQHTASTRDTRATERKH